MDFIKERVSISRKGGASGVYVSSFDQLLIDVDDYEIGFNKRDCDVAQTLGCIDLISRVTIITRLFCP